MCTGWCRVRMNECFSSSSGIWRLSLARRSLTLRDSAIRRHSCEVNSPQGPSPDLFASYLEGRCAHSFSSTFWENDYCRGCALGINPAGADVSIYVSRYICIIRTIFLLHPPLYIFSLYSSNPLLILLLLLRPNVHPARHIYYEQG